MDLDDEELKATRKLNGADRKEKTADKMFEELGCVLEYEDEISFTLANRKKARYITFIKNTRTLMLTSNTTMQELQTINKKCEELGWI